MEEIEDLKRRLQTLESFVSEKKRQQLTYPLDTVSFDIVREGLVAFSQLETGTITADKTLKVVVNGKTYKINVL